MGQAGEDVAEVAVGIEAAATAAFDERINDGAAFAGSGFADEEPVFLSDGGGANGILDQIIVDLDATVPQVNLQGAPLAQSIVNRLSEQALWQMEAARFEK